ncbi:MAG: hypothetical protein AVDCRST_MAG49-2658 [uncultured Thermomicrobiales bacterium]|uniref:Uncharacterized protein n=1 Tax=uncultured Thermomicrobiales bacterium TaxID=1645740 RepID=A0A6J4UZQ5_9BACT|nr:MAG: hypothetical protein AVDCRST_MAG49-2658 [uncultured Thermomicrobiales bacterium]
MVGWATFGVNTAPGRWRSASPGASGLDRQAEIGGGDRESTRSVSDPVARRRTPRGTGPSLGAGAGSGAGSGARSDDHRDRERGRVSGVPVAQRRTDGRGAESRPDPPP